MNELEQRTMEALRVVNASPDPERTIQIFVDVIGRLKSGESRESIAASYGLDWEEVKKHV